MTLHAFDLIVLGILVSAGGGLFLVKAYWRKPRAAPMAPPQAALVCPSTLRQQIHQHLHALTGVRWLTVGALALVLGVTRGEEAGHCPGPRGAPGPDA
jgi:hypothetical protein